MKIEVHSSHQPVKSQRNQAAISFAAACLLFLLASSGKAAGPVVIDRGPHHRTWEYLTRSVDARGSSAFRTHRYVELATGLNKLTEAGWVESNEAIELFADGAIARGGPHQVIFSAALVAAPAIDILTPDSKRLQCRLLGLVYRDALGGGDVLIAEPNPNSRAELVAPNQIVWRAAFDPDIAADVRAVYGRAGLECEVILRQKPDPPALFGLDPDHTRLEVWTEWFDAPEPRKQATTHQRVHDPLLRKLAADPDLVDEFIDFGHMQFTRGIAFRAEDNRSGHTIPVHKQWLKIQGRSFLVESVEHTALNPLLNGLVVAAGNGKGKKAKNRDALVALFAANQGDAAVDFQKRKALITASLLQPSQVLAMSKFAGRDSQPGVSIDWTLVSSTANYTFQNDTTYYISGAVNLSGTGSGPTNVTTFEGGAVIKFAPTNSAKITVTNPIKWEGADYRPVVLTARDDHTVGEAIGAATLSGYYANSALKIDADAAGTNAILQNLRISHATTGIQIVGRADHVISHAQFVHCQNGIAPEHAIYHVRNALMYDVMTNFSAVVSGSSTGRCEHLTIHQASMLNYTNTTSTNLLFFTNSLLVAITNSGAGYQTNDSSNVGTATTGTSVFQTVGAASHYLLDNTYRNLGTVNINASLLADLRKRTTYPPLLLTNSIQVDTTLTPQAQRDTDILDYGFHYEPLDWAASGTSLGSSATLLLKDGVSLGTYGSGSAISLTTSGPSLVSEGSATAPNKLVRYNTVQEQSATNWSSTAGLGVFVQRNSLRFRFTEWSVLAGNDAHFDAQVSSGTPLHSFQHCQFVGGRFLDGTKNANTILSNCFWDRVFIYLDDNSVSGIIRAYNNLFRGGSLTIVEFGSNLWEFKDNLFYFTSITNWGSAPTHNYNAYITGANRLTPHAANDVILTNTPTFQTNILGKYYYPTNDGMLSLLINAGSRNATNSGLYHFTVRGPDQAKETNTVVDIGFHYVALDGSNEPIDSDSDGIPDYLEDGNGDGDLDSGETNYNDANDLGLKVFITRPSNGSVIP